METVRFDLDLAPRLASRFEEAGLQVGAARTRVARLLAEVDAVDAGIGGLLDQGVEWAMLAATDLRWRLHRLTTCDPFLPQVTFRTNADGTVSAEVPFRDAAEAQQWSQGARLHADLVAALGAADPDQADRLFGRLEELLDGPPLVLAGFVGALGPTGLADLTERIQLARQLDPGSLRSRLWHRGRSPQWDQLDTRLAQFAAAGGSVGAWGADDAVELRLRGGGIQVVTMRDLLLSSPEQVAGTFSRDHDLTDHPVLDLGAAIATVVPVGPNVTGSGLLVPRVPDVPGASFWWDDAQGRLQTSTFEMPSTFGLVGQTADQMVTNPWQSVQTAWQNPDQAVAGFFVGASVTVTAAWLGAMAAGAGLLGAGASASAGASMTAAGQAGFVYGSASFVRQVFDDGPCKGERLVAAGGTLMMGSAIGELFSLGGLQTASGMIGVAGVHDFGATQFITCD